MVKLPDESRLNFTMPKKLLMIGGGLLAVGLLIIIVQAVTWTPAKAGDHNTRLWMMLHLGLLCAIPMGLGGLYFAAFNHVSGAAWSVTVRRLAENHIWFIPVSVLNVKR